jgi:hypothetical protein
LITIAKRNSTHSRPGEIQAKFPYSEFCANKCEAKGTCHPACKQTANNGKTDDSFNSGRLVPVTALSQDPLKIVK